jgi:quercetin dioxygenase-like cupin family protein
MAEFVTHAGAPQIERGEGISSVELTPAPLGEQCFIMGTTTFPPGTGLALHCHNTVEQVTLLAGSAVAEIDGRRYEAKPFDTTQVPAGVFHRWANAGEVPMTIMWVYGDTHVTRTFFDTGVTVDQFTRHPT